jgi:hypothetical protein
MDDLRSRPAGVPGNRYNDDRQGNNNTKISTSKIFVDRRYYA